ncbi:MAG: InlB B-repeat-containing protein [Treponema sp.]|nr:InlB B-repeat-containing protein [Treponema sp.]
MKEVWDLKVIQFETNGGSPTPTKQNVLKFELIEKPANPMKADYNFGGWYVDNGTFEIPWDFNKIPAFDLTLYARWEYIGNDNIITFNIANLTQYNDALTAIRTGGNDKDYIMNITANIDGITPLTAALTNTTGFGTGTNLTITLTGNGILNTADANGSMFRVGDFQELIIDGNLTLNGRRNGLNEHTGDNTNTAIIFVQPDGTLRLKNGIITGNTTTQIGSVGGVQLGTNSSFIMEGGEISGNEASQRGGGVTTGSNSTFTMNGGIISGNTAGTQGGGVIVSTNSTFNMNNGTITGNTSNNGGGGVLVQGTFNMTGGSIISNIARQSGGGITINNNGTFSKTGNSVITGFADDAINGNVVRTGDVGTELNGVGHAVSLSTTTPPTRRENTAGAGDNMSWDGTTALGFD